MTLEPEQVVRQAGVEKVPDGVKVRYLRDDYAVLFSCAEVRRVEPPHQEADVLTATVLAHYLLTADGRPLTNTFASYRELPGAGIYYGPFVARTVKPLLRAFGEHPERLLLAGRALGGTSQEVGDASITLQILPRLPVTYAIWRGDDEVASSGTVLFDASASGYLPLEDLVVAAAHGAYALLKAPTGEKEA